jgi:DNA-binding response OmpR family regulator
MKKKLIIAEDDPALLDALQMIFKRAGFEVSGYANGKVLMHNGLDVPDIFLIDKQLSGIDGLDICRYLKNKDTTRHVPVIIFSASPGIEPLVKKAGGDAFLEKPFSNSKLLALVQQLLQ